MALYNVVLAGMIGLVVGSFIGVLVIRLPRRQPVALARSACPHCGHELGAWELIPVVSWLILRRRCRTCGAKLSWFYPIMELSAGAIAVVAALFATGPVLAGICLIGWTILGLIAWALSSA